MPPVAKVRWTALLAAIGLNGMGLTVALAIGLPWLAALFAAAGAASVVHWKRKRLFVAAGVLRSHTIFGGTRDLMRVNRIVDIRDQERLTSFPLVVGLPFHVMTARFYDDQGPRLEFEYWAWDGLRELVDWLLDEAPRADGGLE